MAAPEKPGAAGWLSAGGLPRPSGAVGAAVLAGGQAAVRLHAFIEIRRIVVSEEADDLLYGDVP